MSVKGSNRLSIPDTILKRRRGVRGDPTVEFKPGYSSVFTTSTSIRYDGLSERVGV